MNECNYSSNYSLVAQLVKNSPGSIPGSGRSPGEGIGSPIPYSWASVVAQMVKNLRAMQQTWVRCRGCEDPLEDGMAAHSNHSSVLAWRIPWTEEPGRLQSMETTYQCMKHKRWRFNPWVRKMPWKRKWQSTPVFFLGNSMERGACWDTVHGIKKSRLWLGN